MAVRGRDSLRATWQPCRRSAFSGDAKALIKRLIPDFKSSLVAGSQLSAFLCSIFTLPCDPHHALEISLRLYGLSMMCV